LRLGSTKSSLFEDFFLYSSLIEKKYVSIQESMMEENSSFDKSKTRGTKNQMFPSTFLQFNEIKNRGATKKMVENYSQLSTRKFRAKSTPFVCSKEYYLLSPPL
jgi:hypothetical protein